MVINSVETLAKEWVDDVLRYRLHTLACVSDFYQEHKIKKLSKMYATVVLK